MSMERCYHLDTTRLRPKHFKERGRQIFKFAAVMQELHSVNKRQDKANAYQIVCVSVQFGEQLLSI